MTPSSDLDPEIQQRLDGLLQTALHDRDLRRVQAAVAELLQSPHFLTTLVQSLSEALQHQDTLVQRRAAQILGKLGTLATASIPRLIEALRGPRWTIREAAAMALGAVGSNSESARAALVQASLHDRIALVREAASRALCSLDREIPAASADLQAALRHRFPRVRSRALRALAGLAGHLVNPGAIISQGLEESHARVRRTAAELLGTVGQSAHEAIPALLRRLADGDARVQTAAHHALTQLNSTLPPGLQSWLTRFLHAEGDLGEKLRTLLEHAELPAASREAFTEVCRQRIRWWGASGTGDTAWAFACQAALAAEQGNSARRQLDHVRQREFAWLMARLWTHLSIVKIENAP